MTPISINSEESSGEIPVEVLETTTHRTHRRENASISAMDILLAEISEFQRKKNGEINANISAIILCTALYLFYN